MTEFEHRTWFPGILEVVWGWWKWVLESRMGRKLVSMSLWVLLDITVQGFSEDGFLFHLPGRMFLHWCRVHKLHRGCRLFKEVFAQAAECHCESKRKE